jgi:SAM-dependent methyltransferase
MDVYEEIADSWDNLRQKPMFPEWLEYLKNRWKNGILIDLGCGNCRNLKVFSKCFGLHGTDISKSMIRFAKIYANKNEFKACFTISDIINLPYKNESFDFALLIAVVHHLGTEMERYKALKELKRVLKPNGEAFITVWNKWQRRFLFKPKDIFVPWKKSGKIYNRYYHLFSCRELKNLLKNTGFEIIELGSESKKACLFSRNICALVKKTL